MTRYVLKLEYDGTEFVGWQSQAEGNSVQEKVKQAIRIIEPNASEIVAAGRTDSGVHALGQVIHCDLVKSWQLERLCDALNANLKPNKISILQAAIVDERFSARFSAIRRIYTYRIIVRRAPLALQTNQAWRLTKQLNHEKMQKAANFLIGKHDFTTFRASRCQANSPVRTLDILEVKKKFIPYGYEIRIRAEARSFLHRQVRSIVGTLERVGAGAMTPRELLDALLSCDRSQCGPVAPAQGLYLERVDYNPDPFLAG